MEEAIRDFVYREVHDIKSGFSITRAKDIVLEFDRVACWERVCFHNPSVTGNESPNGPHYDVAQCHPWKADLKKGIIFGGRQDAVQLRVCRTENGSWASGGFLHHKLALRNL